ncbi:peroxiredoxin family protein [Myxococcota bacterium]|nr:peroxiredoxin family protein [Myxococcota bacterium]
MNALKNTGNQLALLGLLLAIGCTMVWFNQAEKVALPENRTLFIGVWLSAVAFAIAAFVKKPSWPGRIAALPALVIGLFLPFTVSISEQILPPGAIQVGETIPNFSAQNDRGEVFDSAQLRGSPVLIKFFRAHW